MAEKGMQEISRSQFWALEDKVAACLLQGKYGHLQVEHHGEGKLYKSEKGDRLFRSIPEQGVYLATPSIIKEYLR